MKKMILVTLLILSISEFIFAPIPIIVYNKKVIVCDDYNFAVEYNKVINYIISHEQSSIKYNPYVHDDGNGNRTIGYGHLLTSRDTFTYMSEENALKLLKLDFNIRLLEVKVNYPSLKRNKLLAVTHFVYCLGITRVSNVLDKEGNLDSIKLYDWCYIGNKKYNSLLELRKYEYKLFNK